MTASTDLRTLNLLLERAELQRDEARAEEARLVMAVRAAEAQCEQLVAYRQEYEARWRQAFAERAAIEVVRCFQGFMERLTLAVAQQRDVVQRTNTRCERASALVQGHEMRAAALRKLIERQQRTARTHAARLEQKQDDEQARLAWARSYAVEAH